MTRRFAILWLLVAVIAIAMPVLAAQRAEDASRRARESQQKFAELQLKHTELDHLRRIAPSWVTEPANSSAEQTILSTRLAAALGSCGLSPATLASSTPSSEPVTNLGLGANSAVKIARHRNTVTLTPITLPKLGEFLGHWRTQEPRWIVASIELAPDSSQPVTPGADLPLRAVLALESLAAEDRKK